VSKKGNPYGVRRNSRTRYWRYGRNGKWVGTVDTQSGAVDMMAKGYDIEIGVLVTYDDGRKAEMQWGVIA
jgi:hypothetical protein